MRTKRDQGAVDRTASGAQPNRRQDPASEAHALAWLSDVEVALKNNRLGLSATVAAARTQLVAQRSSGGRPSATDRRPTRAERLAHTVDVVKQVVDQLTEELQPTRARLDEADALARHVLVLGTATGVVRAGRDVAESVARLRAGRVRNRRPTAAGQLGNT